MTVKNDGLANSIGLKFDALVLDLFLRVQGRLVCQGTVGELKTQFRCGYNLTIDRDVGVGTDASHEAEAEAELESAIKMFFPKAEKLRKNSGPDNFSRIKDQLVFVLPTEEDEENSSRKLDRVTQLFDHLGENKSR